MPLEMLILLKTVTLNLSTISKHNTPGRSTEMNISKSCRYININAKISCLSYVDISWRNPVSTKDVTGSSVKFSKFNKRSLRKWTPWISCVGFNLRVYVYAGKWKTWRTHCIHALRQLDCTSKVWMPRSTNNTDLCLCLSSSQITKYRTKWGQGGFKEDRGSICMSSSPDPMQHLSVVISSTSCLKGLQLCQIFRPAPEVIPKFKPPNPSVIYINASLIQLNVPCVLLVLSKNLYSYRS